MGLQEPETTEWLSTALLKKLKKILHIVNNKLALAIYLSTFSVQFSSVTQSCPRFVTPWTSVRQASLSITNSRSLSKIMFIELVMPSNHLILCHPLLLPLIFSQHQGLFKWVSSLHQVAKVLGLLYLFSASSGPLYSLACGLFLHLFAVKWWDQMPWS